MDFSHVIHFIQLTGDLKFEAEGTNETTLLFQQQYYEFVCLLILFWMLQGLGVFEIPSRIRFSNRVGFEPILFRLVHSSYYTNLTKWVVCS